jgi:hypothetical protein
VSCAMSLSVLARALSISAAVWDCTFSSAATSRSSAAAFLFSFPLTARRAAAK